MRVGNENRKLTRVDIGNRFQHYGPVAGQHLQLVLQYHILEMGQGGLHLSHVVGQILFRLGTTLQVIAMSRFATAPIAAATPGTVGRV